MEGTASAKAESQEDEGWLGCWTVGLDQEATEAQGREVTCLRSQALEGRDVGSTTGVSAAF